MARRPDRLLSSGFQVRAQRVSRARCGQRAWACAVSSTDSTLAAWFLSRVLQTLGRPDFLHSSHERFPTGFLCETQHSIADWCCFKNQTLLATMRTQSQPHEVSCVLLAVELLFPSGGCARSNVQSRTVLQNLRFLSGCWIMYGWVTFSRSLGHDVQLTPKVNPNMQATKKLGSS